ncbi:V-type ATPase subunit [Vagococcus xieshaowenii]|uniref:V-type ATP synthase subunit C n=1 Tax=Vagococcus xieshaowenii TaxID=2562451 RepID=A0AAJ5EF17_9ENTE|nr:V-type ATPase subunit [Vagococcus xieshaowenii]TFZ41006.1 V-type ATP synthase subunit C [Vagococcus xieshaowenii]
MSQPTYHEVNPLVRIKELELISTAEFERMIETGTMEQLATLLKETHYADYIYPGFEHDFEQNLNKEIENEYKEIIEIAPEKEVIWIYTMRYTFHNLKVLTKAKMLGKELDEWCIYDGFYSIETLKRAIQTGISTQLPDSVIESIHEVLLHLEESKVLQGIDVIYDRYFLRTQRELGETLGYSELLDEIISFIDLTNIETMARGILQKRSQNFMTGVLSSQGSISKETFLSYVKDGYESFITFLQQSEYAQVLSPALEQNHIDFVQLGKLKDDFLTEHYEGAQTQAFGPLPLLALLNAKEIEIKNLRTLVVGKKNGFTNQQIRERMRRVYDL